MSKGIAINTILYLLIGVLVVGVIVYLIYTYATGAGMDIADCRSRVQNWCGSCRISGWSSSVGVSSSTSDIYICIKDYFATGTLNAASINCNNMYGAAGDTETFCEQFT
jgi:hypothetical protein